MTTPDAIQPFDWSRILWGDQAGLLYLLEIALRTAVMYSYAVVFARAIGKRGTGQISPFELIVIILISSAAGDPMFYAHVPLLHGLLVLTVVMGLHRIISFLTDWSDRAERVIEGEPVVVVRDGQVMERAIRPGRLSRRELLMMLRQKGVRDIGEVEVALLEPSGGLSVFNASAEDRRRVEPTVPSDRERSGG